MQHTPRTPVLLLPATILDLASAQSPPHYHNNAYPFQAAATGGDPAAPALSSPHFQNPTGGTEPPPLQAAATGGNPAALVYSFPHFPLLNTASILDTVAQIWPAFGDLRSAASAPRAGRLRDAISTLLAEARVIFFSELLTVCGTPALQHHTQSTPGAAVHSWARFLVARGTPPLGQSWSWSLEQCALLTAALLQLVPTSPWPLPAPSITLAFTIWPP